MKVLINHDWAIYGPFSQENDLQEVPVKQNGEQIATVKTGCTGGLPFIGKGRDDRLDRGHHGQEPRAALRRCDE